MVRTAAVLLALTSLAGLSFSANAAHSTPDADAYTVSPEKIGCSKLVESFCDELWAPKRLGNLTIQGDTSRYDIRLGRTRNGTTWAYLLFGKTKLDRKEKLPADFRKRLESKHYFEKLAHLLNHKPYREMTRTEVEQVRALFNQLDTLWTDAIEETAIDRVNVEHPGFYRLTDEKIPTEISQVFFRTRDELEASIYRAIWRDHPGWVRIERIFSRMKAVFLDLIEHHPRIRPDVKARWMDRIRTMTLMIPGSDPVRINDSERRCASTEINGFHLAEKNALVICGGYVTAADAREARRYDVGGMDAARTIAHEIGHALGVFRGEMEETQRSRAARSLTELREATCNRKDLGCAGWRAWQDQFLHDLDEMSWQTEQDPAFLACFRSREPKPGPDAKTLDFIARGWVSAELENQAKRDRFIKMTKKQEILRDGTEHPNPAYLDPCGLYYLFDGKDPFSPDFTLNTFFVNEYRCTQEATPKLCHDKPARCLELAIEQARELEHRLRLRELENAGPFSSVRELQHEGYAEDIEEDLADALGQLAFSRYLEQQTSVADRRADFLSTVAPLCDEPSIAKLYPDEALVQKRYYLDPHSEGLDRRRKFLIAPIRNALACDKDFETPLRECDWYAPPAAEARKK